MYLSELKLWNFRKFGGVDLTGTPSLSVKFKDGLNVLIGENDSGKTAIIDAIRIILGTQSNEYYFLEERDFYKGKDELKIECVFKFKDLQEGKASKFLEWITFDEQKNPRLEVRLTAKKDINGRIRKVLSAGQPDLDNRFEAIDELRVTYLKPLRNADLDLIAGRSSRLAQILRNHDIFKEKDSHPLLGFIDDANKKINSYFREEPEENGGERSVSNHGYKITEVIEKNINAFMGKEKRDNYSIEINISEKNLSSILYSLNLKLSDNKVGLGSLN